MNKLLLAIVMTVVMVSGFSQTVNAATAWYTGPVGAIFHYPDGSFVLYFSGAPPAGCSAGVTVAVGQNGVTTQGFTLIYAGSLTSFTKAKPVQVAYDNANPNCYVNRLLLTN